MRVLCVFGRHAYGDPRRGEGYEHANFLPALEALGHEVRLFESFDRAVYKDFAELNRRFLETVVAWRPQLVLSVLMHYELWPETLALARARCGATVVNWGTDDSWKYAHFSRHLAPAVDLYATTSQSAWEAARREGLKNFVLTQWAAADAALAEPLSADACRYPVSFIGAAYGRRRRWVGALAARGIDVACFGHGWPNGPVETAELRRITRESVVSLNFSDASAGGAQIKARVFEVPGCGGLLLTQDAPHLRDYYEPRKEIEVFGTEAELVDKVQGLLADPVRRDAIAQAGHARTRREHTYTQRFRILVAQAGTSATPGADCTFPEPELRAMEKAHALPAGLKALRALLVTSLTLVFGSERGARAARRLVYEMSSRLVGARTYGPGGWPGRMFYHES